MKTPCVAKCKNNNGICSGCHRTMKEIELWRTLNDNQQEKIMGEIRGIASTHLCSQCGEPTHCDLSAGRSTCWCSTVAPRDTSGIDTEKCLCRKCLEKLPLL